MKSVLVVAVLALAIHILLPALPTIGRSMAVLRSGIWWAAAMAAGAQVLSYGGVGYELRALVALYGDTVGIGRSIAINLAGYSISVIGGGQLGYSAAAYRWLRRSKTSAEAAFLASLAPAVLNVATSGVVAAFGLGYLLTHRRLSWEYGAAFAATVALMALMTALGWLIASHRNIAVAIVDTVTGLYARLRRRPHNRNDSIQLVQRVARSRNALTHGGWRQPVVGDFMNLGFDIATLYFMFVAVRYRPPLDVLVAGYSLPLIVARFSPLPGGLGVTEAGMIGAFAGLGVPTATAIVATLGYRLLSFWIPFVLGLPLVAILDRRTSRTRESRGSSSGEDVLAERRTAQR